MQPVQPSRFTESQIVPDSASTFHRVISDQHFFRRPLIIATLGAVVTALLLVGIALSVGGIAQLVIQEPSPNGLFDAATRSGRFPMNLVSRLVGAIPLLHHSGSALTFLFCVLGGLVVLRTLLRTYVQRKISHQVSRAVNRLREHIQRQALRSNPGDLTGVPRQTAARLFQQTAQQLEENAFQWSFRRLTTTCDLTVLILLLLCVQWRVGIECLVPIIVCWYIARIESERHDTSAHLLTEQVDRGMQRLTEDLDKTRIVAGYGMEKVEHEHFSKSLRAYQERCNQLQYQQQQGRWTSLLISMAAVALPGFILARHLLFGNLISPPAAVVLALVIGFMFLVLRQLQEIPGLYGTATVAADEINQYLLRVPNVSQVVGARFLEPMSRLLQFNQVRVETETNSELLSGLDLKISFGQRVALLSLNRHESEALINLIPRFSDPSAGQVLVDGVDIRNVTLESLRAEAVVVGGDEPLFNTTILENITSGQKNVTRQDAIEASKLVHAESFIRQLPRGYETHLDEHPLSAPGQRFRISLARAVARKPALLVIQEPEAVLDNETKAMLDDTYQRICVGRTVIFLPTRLSTVKRCNRIIMLHQGRVAVEGVYENLVRTSELYRHWEYMRFNVYRADGT
jgi:ABC-type multidrug transport system fused ATPase/permease subunit